MFIQSSTTPHLHSHHHDSAKETAGRREPGRDIGRPEATERPHIGKFGRHSAMRLLQQLLFNSLHQRVGESTPHAQRSYPEGNTPGQVAGSVLNEIRKLAATDATVIGPARDGVDAGLHDAAELLSARSDLPPAVDDDLHTSRSLLESGLADLDAQTAPPGGTTAVGVRLEQVTASRSAVIHIETRDGDTIAITLNASSSYSTAALAGSQDNVRIEASSASSTRSFHLEYTVEGDIDKREQRAIDRLLKRIGRIADKFFDGRIDKALRKLGTLKIDTRELAGLSVQLSASTTVRIAEAYRVTVAAPSVATDKIEPAAAVPGEVVRPDTPLATVAEDTSQPPIAAAPAGNLPSDDLRDLVALFGALTRLLDSTVGGGMERLIEIGRFIAAALETTIEFSTETDEDAPDGHLSAPERGRLAHDLVEKLIESGA